MNQLVWIFKEILYLSAFASMLILIILFVKKVFKKTLSPKWNYYIWILLLIRLMVPYTPESSFSIYSLFYAAAEKVNIPVDEMINNPLQEITSNESNTDNITGTPRVPAVHMGDTGKVPLPSGHNGTLKDGLQEIVHNGKLTVTSVISVLAAGWLILTVLFALYTVMINLVFAIKVKRYYTRLQDERINGILRKCMDTMKIRQQIILLTTKKLRTPSLYVMVRPKILVSKAYMDQLSDAEIEYIFLHELSHFKGKDILVNWILALLQIVYFFNPLIWYAFGRIHEDCEISCDAEALRYIREEEYQSYGHTIIKLIRLFSESNFIPATAGIGKNKSSYKRRILMISKFKKTKWTSTVLAVLLILIVAAAGLTGCKKSTEVINDNTTDISDTTDTADSTGDEGTLSDTTVTDSNTQEVNGTNDQNSLDGDQAGNGITAGDTKASDPAAGEQEQSPSDDPEAVYFGEWVINKVLALGFVGTYSKEDANALIGKELSFTADKATNFGDDSSDIEKVSSEPVYSENVLTSDEFVANYRVSFDSLGIKADSIPEITVTDADGIVCSFLVKDEKNLILVGGGTYFELVRK